MEVIIGEEKKNNGILGSLFGSSDEKPVKTATPPTTKKRVIVKKTETVKKKPPTSNVIQEEVEDIFAAIDNLSMPTSSASTSLLGAKKMELDLDKEFLAMEANITKNVPKKNPSAPAVSKNVKDSVAGSRKEKEDPIDDNPFSFKAFAATVTVEEDIVVIPKDQKVTKTNRENLIKEDIVVGSKKEKGAKANPFSFFSYPANDAPAESISAKLSAGESGKDVAKPELSENRNMKNVSDDEDEDWSDEESTQDIKSKVVKKAQNSDEDDDWDEEEESQNALAPPKESPLNAAHRSRSTSVKTTALMSQLKTENAQLKAELLKAHKQITQLKKKEAEDAKQMEDLIINVESNLQKSRTQYEAEIQKIRLELEQTKQLLREGGESPLLVKELEQHKQFLAESAAVGTRSAEILMVSASEAEKTVNSMVLGIEGLRQLAQTLMAMSRFAEEKALQ